MSLNNLDKKQKYLIRELWILAWRASVQRTNIFKEKVTKEEKAKVDGFRKKVISFLENNIIPEYVGKVDEKRHCENIGRLVEYANGIGNGILGEDGYKYGVAQKLLNLALKYYTVRLIG